MKKQMKALLNADYSKKSKNDVLNIVKTIHEQLGDETFSSVVDLSANQYSRMGEAKLKEIIASFKDAYDDTWEDGIDIVMNVLKSDDDMQAANASDANFAAELGSLDFEKLIGGPLMACVNAQTAASLATVDFIKEVGFKEDELIMVDFSHTRKNVNPYYQKQDAPQGSDTTSEFIEEEVKLTVPFVSILSIPSLRIETCQIDFNVKLNSVYSRNVSDKVQLDASVSAGWGPVKMKVSASYQRSSSTGVKVEKEYNLGVKVVATNDEMPAGLEKVLGILAQ